MSDGFDKEAEREKLREKLADDEEKREHTQRMSELLLQGATMTNRHCDDCGDPIFRKDGQEFCPTCHTVDAADVEEAAEAAGQDPSAAGGPATTPPDGASPPTGRNGATRTPGDDRNPAEPDSEASAGSPDPSAGTPEEPAGTPEPPNRAPAANAAGSDSTAGASRSAPTTAGSESVADARASLARTLNRFAAAAEETDDPRRARDHLQAAREAAEALAALDR